MKHKCARVKMGFEIGEISLFLGNRNNHPAFLLFDARFYLTSAPNE